MCVFRSLTCAFLVTLFVVGHSATNMSVLPANSSPPVVSEDGPMNSPISKDDLTSSPISEEDPKSSPYMNTTESGPVTIVDELTMESLATYQAMVQLRRTYIPILIVAGTFGNVVVVVIHCRLPPSQKSSMSVYFTALAISDTTALWVSLFDTLDTFGITLTADYHVQRHYRDIIMDAMCRIKIWMAFAFNHSSVWILVSMTIHRALGIVWPHRTRKYLTQRNARKVVALIFLVFTLSNAHILYGHSLVTADNNRFAECHFSFVSEGYAEFFNGVWGRVDMALSVVLPFACLLVTNTVLVRTVGRSLREARETLAEGRSSDQFASRDKKLSAMTVTLIVTSLAFLLLTLPITVFMLVETALDFHTVEDVRLKAEHRMAGAVCAMLWFTNLAINFYLYCLTGARYRAAFLRLFGCGGSTDRAPSQTLTSTVPEPTLQSISSTTK